ncbi:MAG: BatA and WFA domain-containing protein [Pirellulales bacterium]|nr:BatA and WFA domain-containing protein [Pirellulales bacterium]
MTFLAPLFLIGAAAGIIPVVLHMINRQKAKELPFSTLRFLRRSVEKTRRRKRVHDLLLLLVRVAVLVLVAVGLAKPTVTQLGSLWGKSQSAVVIVLDNSTSMGLIDGDAPRFETARRAALQVVDQLHEGDQVALLLSGGPPFDRQGQLDRTHENIRQTLSACQVSGQRADLLAAVDNARSILAESDAAQKQIFVVTDGQALSWEGQAGLLESDGKDQDAEDHQRGEAAKIPVIVVDCHHSPQPNTAVRRVTIEAPAPMTGVQVKITAELFGDAMVAQQRHIELWLDGQKKATSPAIAIEPGRQATHDFVFVLDKSGLCQGEVRLVGQDGCPMDDRRFFTLDVDRAVPVAIVKSRDHEIAALADAFYVEKALGAGVSGASAIRTTVLDTAALPTEPLSHFKVIFCVNLPALDVPATRALARYVADGGNLFWIAGDQVDPEAYNQMSRRALPDSNGPGPLLPAPLVDVRSTENEPDLDSWHVAFLDASHPALSPFFEPPSIYQSVLVYRYVSTDAADAPDARVLARLDDGQALLTERPIEKGRVLFLGTNAQVDWTNLPLRPIFLPMLTRLVFNLAGQQQDRHETVTGSPLRMAFDERSQPLGVEIQPPSGETIRLRTESEKGKPGQMFRYTDTYQSGIYLLRPLETQTPPVAWSVNVDPNESNPALIKPDEFVTKLAPAPVMFADNPTDLNPTFRSLREGQSLWEFFLVLVLVGLVVESYLANRLTPRQAPGEKPGGVLPGPDRTARLHGSVVAPTP